MLFQPKETRTFQREKRPLQKTFRNPGAKKTQKVRFHLSIGKTDSKKRQNWLKHTHTLQNSIRIKEQTVPNKQCFQSTEQDIFSSYCLSKSNFLLVYLKIVRKLQQGLRFHKHSTLHEKKGATAKQLFRRVTKRKGSSEIHDCTC